MLSLQKIIMNLCNEITSHIRVENIRDKTLIGSITKKDLNVSLSLYGNIR